MRSLLWLVTQSSIEAPSSSNLGGGNLTFLGYPIELGPARLQVLGQLINSEPFASLHNHLSITIR